MAQGDPPDDVDLVPAHPHVGSHLASQAAGRGFRTRTERLGRGAPADRPVWADLVVVGAEGLELALQLGGRCRRTLTGEEALERLVEPLDLAAGLRVVGPRVHVA